MASSIPATEEDWRQRSIPATEEDRRQRCLTQAAVVFPEFQPSEISVASMSGGISNHLFLATANKHREEETTTQRKTVVVRML